MMDNGSYQGFIYQWTWLGSCKITQINSNPINFSLQYLRSSDSAEMKTWFTVDPYNVDKWAESCVNTYVCGPQNVRESRDSHFWHSRELFSTGCLSTPKTLRTSVTVQTQEKVMEHWRSCVCVCFCVSKTRAPSLHDAMLAGVEAWWRPWHSVTRQRETEDQLCWGATRARAHANKHTSLTPRLVLCACQRPWRSSPPVWYNKKSNVTVVEVIGDRVSFCVCVCNGGAGACRELVRRA